MLSLLSLREFIDGLTSLRKTKKKGFYYRDKELDDRLGELTDKGTLSDKLFSYSVTPIDDLESVTLQRTYLGPNDAEESFMQRCGFMNDVEVRSVDVTKTPTWEVYTKYGIPRREEVSIFKIILECCLNGVCFNAEKKTRSKKTADELAGTVGTRVFFLTCMYNPNKVEVRDFGRALERSE